MWNSVLQALGIQALSLAFVAVLILITFANAWWFRLGAKQRTTPLVKDLLRPPGYSLSRKMGTLEEEMIARFAMMIAFPGYFATFCLAQIAFGGVKIQSWMIVPPTIIAAVGGITEARRLSKLAEKRRDLAIALDGEMFVGEELSQLMLNGCRVFHDVPYRYGNIDHVVVSKSGVYAVDTKTLGKPKEGDDKASVIVNYQTGMMMFPDREVPIDTKQAEASVRWLSSTLSASTTLKVEPEAMLALPGWFIKERIGDRGKFPFVLNPANAVRFFVRSADRYSNEQITAIAHQLDLLCRNVEPNEKAEQTRWEE